MSMRTRRNKRRQAYGATLWSWMEIFEVQILTQRYFANHPDYLVVDQGELAKLDRDICQLFNKKSLNERCLGTEKICPFLRDYTGDYRLILKVILWGKTWKSEAGYIFISEWMRPEDFEPTLIGAHSFRKLWSAPPLVLIMLLLSHNGWKQDTPFPTNLNGILLWKIILNSRYAMIPTKTLHTKRENSTAASVRSWLKNGHPVLRKRYCVCVEKPVACPSLFGGYDVRSGLSPAEWDGLNGTG